MIRSGIILTSHGKFPRVTFWLFAPQRPSEPSESRAADGPAGKLAGRPAGRQAVHQPARPPLMPLTGLVLKLCPALMNEPPVSAPI